MPDTSLNSYLSARGFASSTIRCVSVFAFCLRRGSSTMIADLVILSGPFGVLLPRIALRFRKHFFATTSSDFSRIASASTLSPQPITLTHLPSSRSL